ncbi:hypothetical protein VIOR3934_06454 [Vibrio orientalis CIP 102891 = ATCC 33934]|uniref:Uncharacterized protein n=1 Tax=Vibrio orientalis CIP 102891 = ATCC 33934 TaxID=675816 RepID=C9QDF9_VIBOR|nr:hypothetical protein [Vibrio orientalis]EEX95061.1 hypothetical protein VIA_000524 [Vibrio orientalis CIP 102891 = ATCC 33934]EGU52122.1 hypothetical protein VIOR3934_06454 [Vibrio orientalis CIP 102891 = ATCC 33934]
MNRYLSKGEYAAFLSLLHFSYLLVKGASNKDRSSFLVLVGIYISSIFLQGFAIGLFYFGVQHYIDETSSGYVTRVLSYIPMEFTKVEQLVISFAPAILLLVICSKVLSVSRVGLSRLVLRFREHLISKYQNTENIISCEGDETFYKNMDGTFGAMRALFLNAFVFAQAFVALGVLFYFEPYLALFNIVFLIVFMFILTKVKKKKGGKEQKESQKDAMEAAAEAAAEMEGVGISSKSFERLERMRIYGRNATNLVLFSSVVVGVVGSLDFLTSLDKLTLTLFLLRYISNIYTPIAVISASCVPFKENIVALVNIENYLHALGPNAKKESDVKRGLLFISKSFGDRALFTDPNTIDEAELKYKEIIGLEQIRVETANFSKDYPREKKKIKHFVKNHVCTTDNVYFLV